MESVSRFWKWFASNANLLAQFSTNHEKCLNLTLDELKRIHSGIAVEFGEEKSGRLTMTVSANGEKSLFPIVNNIIRDAPVIAGWRFHAFRQRVEPESAKKLSVYWDGVELRASEMMFEPLVENGNLDIIVYVDGLDKIGYNSTAMAALMILDHLLGEYDCATKVRSFDFHEMPSEIEDIRGLRPLVELPNLIDRRSGA